jgi:hypothetical protein
MEPNDEGLARLRRIETKVFLIGEKIGVDAKQTEPFPVTKATDEAAPTIVLPGLDVPLSRIKRDCTLAGVDPYEYPIDVFVGGEVVANVGFYKC